MALLLVLVGCGDDASREDLRPRCAPAFRHAYDACAGGAAAPQPCDRADCAAFCQSDRLNDPAAWLGSGAHVPAPDCYEEQEAWIACNESASSSTHCDCAAEYNAVIACAPTGL